MPASRLLAVLMLAAGVAVAGPPPAAESEAALLAELTARDPKLFVLRQEKKPDGLVRFVMGKLLEGQPGNRAATVKSFLEKYGTLLGCPAGRAPADLEPIRDEPTTKGHKLVMVPARNGVPFLSGALSFTFDEAGNLVAASGRYQDLASARMSSMSAADAAKKALDYLTEKVPGAYLSGDGSVREHIRSSPTGELSHVFEVGLTLGDGRQPWRATLGPGGELLHHEPDTSGYDGSGKTFSSYPDISSTASVALTELVAPRSAKAPRPLKGKFFYPESEAILHAISKNGVYDYLPRLGQEWGVDLLFYDPRFLEVNVYYHLMQARKHAIEDAKVPEVDRKDKPMRYDVWEYPKRGKDPDNPYGKTINNAYYAADTWDMHFPVINPGLPMDPLLFRTGAVDASVIYHEYGHHVMNSFGYDIRNSSDTYDEFLIAQSIAEGYADYFSYTLHKVPRIGDVFMKGGTYPDGSSLAREIPVNITWCDLPKMRDYYQLSQLFSSICYGMTPTTGDLTLQIVTKALRTTVPLTYDRFEEELIPQLKHDYNDETAQIIENGLTKRKVGVCRFNHIPWPDDK